MTGSDDIDHAAHHGSPTMPTVPAELTSWDEWLPLRQAAAVAPCSAGLYRIRRIGFDGLDYVGQTGMGTMTLRKLLAMLSGLYAVDMPYRDPHTAAPGLWAMRHATGCDFEVSTALVMGNVAHRKGLEALAISLYRIERGKSPTLAFGRIPAGYRGSSGNNAQLVRAGRRFRGGPHPDTLPQHVTGVPPVGPLSGDVLSEGWCGHSWSAWASALDVAQGIGGATVGLYRIADGQREPLLYVGQGAIAARLTSHLRKASAAGHAQGVFFAGDTQCSYVSNAQWDGRQRLELENDLVAAHVLRWGEPPLAQFLG